MARLIERDQEIARLASAWSDARSGAGRVLILEGDAGIGKSSLLRHATDSARADGIRILAARGGELERSHPYGVATTLLSPLFRDGGESLLRGPAARSRRVLSRDGGDGDSIERQAALHSLFWLVVNASEEGPMLLTVDDAHWADEASLRFVAYLAQRIADLPILFVVALRPAEAAATEVGEQVRSHAGAERLVLRPLSRRGVTELLASSMPEDTAEERADDLWVTTGGNPFYVTELLRTTADPSTLGASSTGLIPDTVSSAIRRRLAAIGPVARRVADALAVLGEAATPARVERMAGIGGDEAEQVMRQMIEKALVERERLRFAHPIVHDAVYGAIPPLVRRRLHATAAQVLDADGAPITAVAGQLLEAEPSGDPGSVRTLRNAARAALAQGDAPSASTFLRRALEEPPPADDRGSVLLELAQSEAAEGSPRAADRYDEAIRLLDQPQDRARARHAQGHALIASARWTDAATTFRRGLAEADASDIELRSRLEAGFVASAYVGLVDHGEAEERLKRILSAPLTDPAHRELAAWSAFQQTMAPGADARDVVRLARRAIDGGDLHELIPSSQVVELVAGVLLAADEIVEDIHLLDRGMAVAQEIGAFGKVGLFSYCRSLAFLLAGRVQDAIADAEAARGAYEMGWRMFYPATSAALAWALLERGDLAAAARATTMDDAEWSQGIDYQFMVRIARGRTALAGGDLAEAAAQFELARAAGETVGIHSHSLLGDWRTWYAVTLRRMGRKADAVRVADEAVDLAERWGAPGARARAAWAGGIAGGGPGGIDRLEHARALLDGSPLQLDRARIGVDLGAALRRAGRIREARDELRHSADLAQRLGATALLERARQELSAAGARPRRYAVTGIESLTPSELRVARLAADGRTNREVAETLFVTPKAVEYHLANAYRKLQIRSRNELPAALGASEGASV